MAIHFRGLYVDKDVVYVGIPDKKWTDAVGLEVQRHDSEKYHVTRDNFKNTERNKQRMKSVEFGSLRDRHQGQKSFNEKSWDHRWNRHAPTPYQNSRYYNPVPRFDALPGRHDGAHVNQYRPSLARQFMPLSPRHHQPLPSAEFPRLSPPRGMKRTYDQMRGYQFMSLPCLVYACFCQQ